MFVLRVPGRLSCQSEIPAWAGTARPAPKVALIVTGLRGQLRWIFNDAVEANFAIDYEHDTSEAKADTLIAIQYPLGPVRARDSDERLRPVEHRVRAARADARRQTGALEFRTTTASFPRHRFSTYATYNDPATGLTFNPQSGLDKLGGSARWIGS